MLTFTKYGSGPTVWLAFHGIGQDSRCFEPFAHRLALTHTIYSIDLPFHGESRLTHWPSVITSTYWQSLLTEFIATHHIDRFSAVGFSMGGRFALLTAQLLATRVDELLLLAPDGITQDPWFTLATSTRAGRTLLRFFLNNSPLLMKAAYLLVKVGLLSAPLLRFVEATMQTPDQRTQIYQSWTGFRQLTINLQEFASAMADHAVQVHLFLGEHDAVLPRRSVQPLLDALPNCTLRILPTGHSSLVRRVAEQL